MVHIIQDILKMEKEKALEFIILKTKIFILENGLKIIEMDLGFIFKKTKIFIMENFKIIIKMVWEHSILIVQKFMIH